MVALVIVTALLWPYAARNTAAQETRKKSYDLSAKKAGDVLKLSPEVWTEINRFVFLIAFDVYQPGDTNLVLVKQFNKLDSYPKLHQACRRWGDVTFQNLQKLADELAAGDIRRLLTDLKAAVDRRVVDPVGAEKAFVVAADKLVGKLSQWETLSTSVKQDLDFLFTQTLAAAIQLRAAQTPEERRIVDVGPELANVVAALAGVNDHWGALSSDLSALRKEMQTNLNSTDPFLLDITLEIGLTSWEAVEAPAKTFRTNVPMQRRYLTGDNYYDECPLKENIWYLMQTKDQFRYPVRALLGIKGIENEPDIGFLVGLPTGPGEPDTKMQWRFQRMGRGWWRIINRAEGDSKYLTFSSLNFAIPKVMTSLPGNPLRQLWRCVTTGEEGYFRLYNASLGETQSLRQEYQPRMVGWVPLVNYTNMKKSEKSPEQYWRFEAIPAKTP